MVLERELYGKISDERKVSEVVSEMAQKVENTLINYRISLGGRSNKTRQSRHQHTL